jgi:hypothetical protein
MATLHVTNGDTAVPVLRAGGIDGTILPWRDVLHEGPVRAMDWAALRQLRARFIASRAWASYEEALAQFSSRDDALLAALRDGTKVVLWFEHDLYDQLQLAQVLAMAAPAVRAGAAVGLAQAEDYIGVMSPTAVRALAARVVPIREPHVQLAEAAWRAFTTEGLEPLSRFAHESPGDDDALPYLRPALQRLLQEVPNAVTGLSRTELQALRAVAGGAHSIHAAFMKAHHDAESPVWLGDASFAALVRDLCAGPRPLLARRGDAISLTDDGRAVLDGRGSRVDHCGIDRWIGATHLHVTPPT